MCSRGRQSKRSVCRSFWFGWLTGCLSQPQVRTEFFALCGFQRGTSYFRIWAPGVPKSCFVDHKRPSRCIQISKKVSKGTKRCISTKALRAGISSCSLKSYPCTADGIAPCKLSGHRSHNLGRMQKAWLKALFYTRRGQG